MPNEGGTEELEDVARAFLAALDERRWHDAAVLVDSQTLERFRAWSIKLLDLRAHQPAQPGDSDTFFIPATVLMGVADAATAQRLSATQLLARVAENAIQRTSSAIKGSDSRRRSGLRGRWWEWSPPPGTALPHAIKPDGGTATAGTRRPQGCIRSTSSGLPLGGASAMPT